MKPPPETIRFTQPLRDVKLSAYGVVTSEPSWIQRERERAAYERGRQEGEMALSEQLLRQRRELLELQQGVLTSLRQAVPQVMRETESVLVALAIEVARKLVVDLPISAELIEATVRQALTQVQDSTRFEVLLCAEDLDLLQRANSPMLLPSGGQESMNIASSPEVTRGGCLVRTRFGVIDARRETKIQLLKEALTV